LNISGRFKSSLAAARHNTADIKEDVTL